MYNVTYNKELPCNDAITFDTRMFPKKIYWWHDVGEHTLSKCFNLTEVVNCLTSGGFFVLDLSSDPYMNTLSNFNSPAFQQILQLFTDHNISLKQLILLTPTPEPLFKKLMTVGYDEYPSNKPFEFSFKYFFYNRFFLDVTNNIKLKRPWLQTLYFEKDIQTHFLSLSRKDTLPRRFLNHLLHEEDLFKYGLVSHKRIKEDPFNISDDELLLQDKAFITDHITRRLNYINFGYKKHLLDEEFTSKCAMNGDNYTFHSLMSSKVFFELVNESWPFVNNALFVSEKLLKSIFAKNIFVVFGNPYTLKYLRNLGFKTFSHIFDESYDEKLNTKSRVTAIFKLLHNLVSLPISDCKKIYDETQEILDYNYNHLLKSKWNFQIHKKIENYIIERSLYD